LTLVQVRAVVQRLMLLDKIVLDCEALWRSLTVDSDVEAGGRGFSACEKNCLCSSFNVTTVPLPTIYYLRHRSLLLLSNPFPSSIIGSSLVPVIHRRVFAENVEAILLEYAKASYPFLSVVQNILLTFVIITQNYNVDNAESLKKSALVRALTTHYTLTALSNVGHHRCLKFASSYSYSSSCT
jgi:hypothetical protein